MRRLILALILSLGFGLVAAGEKEGGVIGTGVVGEVTALDGFEVAGMRFNLPDTIELDGIDRVEDLRMGMTISLRTARDGEGWQATELRRLPVLVGPVTGENEVMGVTVIGDLPTSGRVIVDGFWSSQGVVATRITPTETEEDRVTGRYNPAGLVGTVPLRRGFPNNAEPGDVVTIRGEYLSGGFTVVEMETGVFKGSMPEVLLAEGFLGEPNEAGDATLMTVDVKMAMSRQAISDGQRIRRCALRGRLDYEQSTLSASEVQTLEDFCISAIR